MRFFYLIPASAGIVFRFPENNVFRAVCMTLPEGDWANITHRLLTPKYIKVTDLVLANIQHVTQIDQDRKYSPTACDFKEIHSQTDSDRPPEKKAILQDFPPTEGPKNGNSRLKKRKRSRKRKYRGNGRNGRKTNGKRSAERSIEKIGGEIGGKIDRKDRRKNRSKKNGPEKHEAKKRDQAIVSIALIRMSAILY